MKPGHALSRTAASIWTYRTVRVVLAAMFLVAGALKLTEPQVFAVTIEAFGIVPGPLALPIAMGLPVIEILLALGLLVDARWCLEGTGGLTVFFIAILLYGIHIGLDIDCGCYGPSDPEAKAFSSLHTSLYRDLAMLAAITYLHWWRWRNDRGIFLQRTAPRCHAADA